MAQNDEFEELRDDYAAKQRERFLRVMRKKWDKILPIPTVIAMKWVGIDGKKGSHDPGKGQTGTVEITFGDEVMEFDVDPESHFYKLHGTHIKAAQAYALWKWHGARRTPLSDDGNKYLTEPDYKAPTFVWPSQAKAA